MKKYGELEIHRLTGWDWFWNLVWPRYQLRRIGRKLRAKYADPNYGVRFSLGGKTYSVDAEGNPTHVEG